MGTAAQHPQHLLVKVEKATADAAIAVRASLVLAGVLIDFQFHKVLRHEFYAAILKVSHDALVSVQGQLCDTATVQPWKRRQSSSSRRQIAAAPVGQLFKDSFCEIGGKQKLLGRSAKLLRFT